MKKILKPILKAYLKFFTKLVLAVHRPAVIVVAGSANKYFFKEAVLEALKKQGHMARGNPKNFNTEIGLPLSILDLPSGYNSYKEWLPALLKAPKCLFKKGFPRYLVLSLGVAGPGDMKYLLSLVKPLAAVLTEINQRYLESFKDMDSLVDEYKQLSQKMPKESLFVYNCDNRRVKEVIKLNRGEKLSFGFSPAADYRVLDIIKGIKNSFSCINNGTKTTYRIKQPGNHHVFSKIVSEILVNYVDKRV